MKKNASCGVIGAGYVGLAATLLFVEKLGWHVRCADIDERRIGVLRGGGIDLLEPGLAAALPHLSVDYTTDVRDVCSSESCLVLCLPTPSGEDGSTDMRALYDCLGVIAEQNDSPELLLLIRSTLPAGATRALQDFYSTRRESRSAPAQRYAFVHYPEFLQEGKAHEGALFPDRIILGSDESWALDHLTTIYESVFPGVPILPMSPESAELSKQAANAYLATSISFANEISHIASLAGASMEDVQRALRSDPRIGLAPLSPSPGFGGACLPKDLSSLRHLAHDYAIPTPILDGAAQRNILQQERALGFVRELLRETPSPTIGVLGLTFKAHTADTRSSPAWDICEALCSLGCSVRVHDPVAPESPVVALRCESWQEALEGVDAALLLTEWPEYSDICLYEAQSLMRPGAFFLDGRRSLVTAHVPAGLLYQAL